jgi:solute carrier family 25 phosphate transporter 23/24/25/41
MPYVGFKLSAFDLMKRLHSQVYNSDTISDIRNLIYGGIAGCVAVTLTFPTDVLRRIIQAEISSELRAPSYLTTIKRVFARDGLSGFFKGLKVTYYKVVPSTAIAFMTNEYLKNLTHLTNRK